MADDRHDFRSTPANSGEADPLESHSINAPSHDDHLAVDSELGWGRLARRITGWTSNLLVTFLILAAGLAFGVQVLVWWKNAPDESKPQGKSAEDSFAVDAWAEFRGTGNHLRCLTVQAEEAVATRRCEDVCLASAEAAGVPSGLPTLAEQGVLEKLASISPIRESPRGVLVYRYPGDFRLWVGVKVPKEAPGDSRPPMSENDDSTGGSPLPSGSRIVAWTFLLPAGEREWTIYHISAVTKESMESDYDLGREQDAFFPLPPGAAVVSRFCPGPGSFFGVFEETVQGASANWPIFLDHELEEKGWSPVTLWSGESSRRRTFSRDTSASEQSFLTVEILQRPDRPARGLVFQFRWMTGGQETRSESQ